MAEITAKLTQHAEAQDIQAPDMPPGATARLVSLESTGNGQISMDLTRLMPMASTMAMKSATKMSMAAEGQSMDMTMDMTVDVDLKSQ